MGDEVAGHRRHADRGQAGRRIATDHKFESVERARQRRAERAGDRRRRAAADHDSLVVAAKVKAAAERCGEAAGELGIAGLEPDRAADAARPDRLQRHDHAAAERHPPAIKRVGFDRVDFAGRPDPEQQKERKSQQQAADRGNHERAHGIDAGLARQPVAVRQIEQHRMQHRDEAAHDRHHEAANGSDQHRQHHKARLVRAHERAQPARRLEIA